MSSIMEDAPQPIQKLKLYGPIAATLITVGLYFGAQLLGGILISLVPAMKGWSEEHAKSWLTNSVWAQFLFIAIVEAISLGVVYKVLAHRKATFRDIGLTALKLKYIFQAALGFILYLIAYVVLLTVISKLVPSLNIDQKQELGFNTAAAGNDLWPIFVSLVILPPITEEIVMRGFLYSGLKTRLSILPAAIITSLLFAAAHLGEGGNSGLLWVAAIDTFILSMVLCYLREFTHSLWPGIGVHMIKNGIAFVILFNIVNII